MRLLAHLSGDAALLQLFRLQGDIYSQLAMQLFKKREISEVDAEDRKRAKVICLGTVCLTDGIA